MADTSFLSVMPFIETGIVSEEIYKNYYLINVQQRYDSENIVAQMLTLTDVDSILFNSSREDVTERMEIDFLIC